MPGVLYRGESSTCSLGPLPGQVPPSPQFSSASFFPDSEAEARMELGRREGGRGWSPPANGRSRSPINNSNSGHNSSNSISNNASNRIGFTEETERGSIAIRSLMTTRNVSLSRSDLLVVGRRYSLEPAPIVRERSRSQPPAIPHSAPAATAMGEHLAEMALQSALAPCALPTIHISKDVSQGESYVEEGHHSSSKPPGDEARVDAPNSSSKSSFNSSSKCSGASSSFGISPSTYKSSPRKGEKDNPHELPTDLSDSVESDPDKEKIPCSVTEVVTCPTVSTHHVGREVSNTVYGLPIDTLFTLLFTNSKFMLDLHTARKTYDLVPSSWQSNAETNQKIRQVTYTLTLPTNSFGPKVSHVTETQVISSFSKSSEIYAIDAEASNSGIPYADSFYVSNHWCLTRESANETRLALWSQVKYKKNVWGFMKNVIDKNAFSGMESLMSDLNASLLLEVDRANVKRTRRRRRRLGSKDSEIGDSLIQLPPPGIAITDIHKATQISSRKLTFPSVSIEPASPQVKSSVKTVGLMFLCLLLAVNAFLYYRLYDLEERVVNNVSFKSLGLDSSIFKFKGPSNKEGLSDDWVQVLQKQEALHIEELERWRKAVMEATNYLRLAEESLRKLHDSIPIQQASKMQHLLQQLQVLQEMQEEQHQGKGAPPISESPPPPPKEKGPLNSWSAFPLEHSS